MSYIVEWGSAFRNMTEEAKRIKDEYLAEKENSARAEALKEKLYDIADTRQFCVVVSSEGNVRCVRHIIRVSDDANEHLDELKAEYYADYAQLPTDEFHFFTGLHRAEAFARLEG